MKKILLALLACTLVLSLSGCTTYTKLNDPEIIAFQKSIKRQYWSIRKINFKRSDGGGDIYITFEMWTLEENEILDIVRQLRKVVMQEELCQRWNGSRIFGDGRNIHVGFQHVFADLAPGYFDIYGFEADYYTPIYRSDRDPSEYHIDGYFTWKGVFWKGAPPDVPKKEVPEKSYTIVD